LHKRFTVAEILTVTGGRLLQGSPATPVAGFAYDSRNVAPGDCFVAMVGERVDGHAYAAGAVEKGAVAVLCARPVDAPGAAVIQVDDPLQALGQLGRAYRERFTIPVVGVTGSVGKTTTKEMVAACLSGRYKPYRSAGNLNSEVGLPITLMELTAEHEVAVLEMGMRALGEITYLCSIARPSIGVVTNVGTSHLELLGTQANIARAKSELPRALPAEGAAVLNWDDPFVRAMAAETKADVWFYGLGDIAEGAPERPPADRWVTACSIERAGETGQRFTLVTPVGEVLVTLPAPGRHLVLNACAAAAVGLHLGLSLREIAHGLSLYEPSGSRMRILTADGIRILDDTYNAAPVSMVAALQTGREIAGTGRLIACLGDMYELGPAAAQGHRQVGEAAGRLADAVIAVGDLAREIATAAGPKGQYFPSKVEAIQQLRAILRPGDTLLVKGSRGMKMEEIVEAFA
jgi:UDP-N-acetylmuramoyl-tripeptide--D-alanyl-D-alanine ligase